MNYERKKCWDTSCEADGDVFLYKVENRMILDSRNYCRTHLKSNIPGPVREYSESEVPDIAEFEVDMIFCMPKTNSFIVCFREKNGVLRWNYRVNARSAATIVAILSGGQEDNAVYSMICDLINAVDAHLKSVVVNFERGELFAEAAILSGERTIQLRISPINAILLANRARIPIYLTHPAITFCATEY